jgi:hypothetical protein
MRACSHVHHSVKTPKLQSKFLSWLKDVQAVLNLPLPITESPGIEVGVIIGMIVAIRYGFYVVLKRMQSALRHTAQSAERAFAAAQNKCTTLFTQSCEWVAQVRFHLQ